MGSFIGNQEGLQTFLSDEIDKWKKDISGLASVAANDPQLAYSAFVYGTSKRWNFVSRTTPDISGLLNPLEYHIKEEFLPAITGKLHIPDNIRRIFSLPAKMGGMGISNATETSDMEYNNSIKATLALTEALFNQADCYNENVDEQASILSSIKSAREEFFKRERANIVVGVVDNLTFCGRYLENKKGHPSYDHRSLKSGLVKNLSQKIEISAIPRGLKSQYPLNL